MWWLESILHLVVDMYKCYAMLNAVAVSISGSAGSSVDAAVLQGNELPA